MPVGRPLMHAGHAQQFLFLERRRQDLQADRQPALREAGGNADAGKPGQIA